MVKHGNTPPEDSKKKPKARRDRRKIATGRPAFLELDYKPLSEPQWLIVEDKLGAQLKKDLREQLSGITMLYAMSQISRPSRSLSAVVNEIDLWCRLTDRLRTRIWDVRTQPARHPAGPGTLRVIFEDHFSPSENLISKNYPLGQFATFLDGFAKVGRHYVARLKDRRFRSGHETELWLVWAALLLVLCRRAEIPIKRPKGLNPGIAVLFAKLQETLSSAKDPSVAARATSTERPGLHTKSVTRIPLKAGASLTKNINRAIALADDESAADHFLLLILWSLDLAQVGSDKLLPPAMKPIISRLRAQMRSISPSKAEPTRTSKVGMPKSAQNV